MRTAGSTTTPLPMIAVTCGYLLCRIVDTVEDDDTLAPRDQDALYDLFLAALEGYGTPEEFAERFKALTGFAADSDEYILASQTPRVFAVLGTLPDTYPSLVTRWVAEMTYGMAIYSHRPVGDDGLHALLDPRDLERYCYFVAGTVGHMLTDLFVEDLGTDLDELTRSSLPGPAAALADRNRDLVARATGV